MTAAIALSTAASRSAETAALAAAARHQRVAGSTLARQRSRRAEAGDAGDHFHVLLELAAEELAVRPVGNAETQVHRLELMIDEQPCAAARFNRWQRREQGVDRLR